MTDNTSSYSHHPYYILAPDYRESSAGVKVMHHLCHLLNEQGEEAYIVGAQNLDRNLRTPTLTPETSSRHKEEQRIPIAIYPEIVTGNPLNARVCVRYMLNKEGVINGNSMHAGPDDLFFYYSPAFTPTPHGQFDYLRLNTHDLELFKPDPDCPKTGPLLYLNRIPQNSIEFAGLPQDIGILSNQSPLPLSELARKLQGATVLYSYESSATCTLAMLCGCPVVAMTHPEYEQLGFSSQTLSPYGGRGYALTDSEDALEAARATLPAFRAALGRLRVHTLRELGVLIRKTQERAAEAARALPAGVTTPATARPACSLRAVREVHLTAVVVGSSAAMHPKTLESLQLQSRPAERVLHLDGTAIPLHLGLLDAGRTLPPPDTSAGGDCWTVLCDDEDVLQADALAGMAYLCGNNPAMRWLHSDAALLKPDGSTERLYPPDASRRLLRSGFALPGIIAVRSDLLATELVHAEGLNPRNWRQALPYLLLQGTTKDALVHVPEAWITHRNAPAGEPDLLPAPAPIHHQVASSDAPLVSIMIPSRDQLPVLQRCLTTIFEQSGATPFEIIVVAHATSDPEAASFLKELPAAAPGRLQVMIDCGSFNFSRLINRAAGVARGQFLLLLNNDTAALHPEWLQQLIAEFDDPEVGIVAPRLVFPDGRIQHAGAVLGLSGAADFPWVGAPMDAPGHLGLLGHAREVSAVTGAALMIRRALFEELGGMDESYAIGFGDFDLCLRAGALGTRCVWTPASTLLHDAGRSLKTFFAPPERAAEAQQAFTAERARFVRTWLPQLGRDPHYNINLSLTSKHYEPEAGKALQVFPVLSPVGPRVLALPADNAGSGRYRVINPAEAAAWHLLAATRTVPGYPVPAQFSRLEIDTLFSQRQVDNNHLQALSELRTLMPKLRIVMDFDDLLTEVPKHSHHFSSVWPDIKRRVATLCNLADCITASTEPLAAHLRAWHDDVRVIPNGIDPTLWQSPAERRVRSGKLRVGWAGGLSHAGDLAVIREVVAALADEVEWVFFGMCLEDMQPHLAEFHHGVPFEDYPARLASLRLDLAIAPLEDNAFNECKSNLRLLEYGALGIPVIASDLLPYRCGLPVQRLDNRPTSWIRAIRERIDERDTLQRDGEQLREAVLRDWTQDKMLPAWVSAWTA
jgi:O-antigen biosynthesis protein